MPGRDYSDSTCLYFVTLNAKIKSVMAGSEIDLLVPFTSCRALGEQANEGIHVYRRQGKWLVFAYCLMPDHLHLLVSPQGGANLCTLLGGYESYITRVAWEFGVQGQLWQRSFYDHILRRGKDAERIIAYILNNPVKAGWVKDWEDWPWCGTPDLS